MSWRENRRDGTRRVQRVVATLGREAELAEDGRPDALLSFAARFSETLMLLSARRAGSLDLAPACTGHRLDS